MDSKEKPVVEIKPEETEEKSAAKRPAFKIKFFKAHYLVFLIILVVLLIGAVSGGFYLGQHRSQTQPKLIVNHPTSISQVPPSPTGWPTMPPSDCTASHMRVLTDNGNTDEGCVEYFDLGVITEGKYKGYKRLIVALPGQRMSYRIIATNDNKTYILDGDPKDLTYPEGTLPNPYPYFNKKIIVGVDNLSSNFPQTISVDNHFSLFKVDIYESTTQSGETITFSPIIKDFSNYIQLPFATPNLNFYVKKYQDWQNDPNKAVKDLYFNNTTEIIGVDSQGLGYSYTLTTSQAIADYNTLKTKSPNDYHAAPSLNFTQADVDTTQPIYKTYGVSFPEACGENIYTNEFKNLKDSQLTKLGTLKNGIDIYKLSDASVQLLALTFNLKIADVSDQDGEWSSWNKIPKPSSADYLAKNPLLFFKDPWGNWLAQGEFDYILPGGCGKPVIYLYPPKPTKVSVKFASAIKFDVDIPTYSNGWSVLANPDGMLTDLNPKATDCSKIDFTRAGSEYAKESCSSGKYPYLYWAGRSLERTYPQLDEGWIVSRAGLSEFLNQKLDQIGLNKKEKGDMLEYWLPQLQTKNAPYYKISFLQNNEMNYLVPMSISPVPTSVLRVFLDYQTLNSKPSTNPNPQIFPKFTRNGFTMVEWGGLEK